MPKRRRTFKGRPRSSRFRRKRRKNNVVSIRRPMIADSLIVTMRYHTTILIDPVAGVGGYHTFRANSINDPDQTAVGHQPMAHDQYSNFYAHYTVIGSKLTAKFVSQDTSETMGSGYCGVGLIRDLSAVSTDADELIERRDNSMGIMTTSGAKQYCTITKGYSPKRFFGYNNMTDSAQTRTAFGSNPTDEAYFVVFLAPLMPVGDLSSTPVSVTIDYRVKLTERIDLSKS